MKLYIKKTLFMTSVLIFGVFCVNTAFAQEQDMSNPAPGEGFVAEESIMQGGGNQMIDEAINEAENKADLEKTRLMEELLNEGLSEDELLSEEYFSEETTSEEGGASTVSEGVGQGMSSGVVNDAGMQPGENPGKDVETERVDKEELEGYVMSVNSLLGGIKRIGIGLTLYAIIISLMVGLLIWRVFYVKEY